MSVGSLSLSPNSTLVISINGGGSGAPLTIEGCLSADGELVLAPGQLPTSNGTSLYVVNTSCINSTFATVSVSGLSCSVTATQQVAANGLAVLLTPTPGCRGKGAKLPAWAIGLIVAGVVLGSALGIGGLLLILRSRGYRSCLFNADG